MIIHNGMTYLKLTVLQLIGKYSVESDGRMILYRDLGRRTQQGSDCDTHKCNIWGSDSLMAKQYCRHLQHTHR